MRWVAVAGALALFASNAGAEKPLERDILLRAARNAVARKDLGEGIRRFRTLLERFPDEDNGRTELAGVLAQAERLDEAVAEYVRMIDRHPENRDLRKRVSDVHLRRKAYAAARRELEWLHAGDRIDPDVRARLALVDLIENKYDRALARYQGLLDEKLERRDLWPGWLDAAASASELSAAHARTALALHECLLAPAWKDPVSLTRLGWVMRRLKEPKKALGLLERALMLAPDDRKVRLQVADTAHEVGELEKAEEHYQLLLRSLPAR